MTSEARNRLALQLRTSVELLIARPAPESYNQVSKMLPALATAGMECPALEQASSTMNAVCDRYERIGKVGLRDREAAALREAAAGIDQRLPFLPVNKLAKAVAQVEIFCATVGA
jgi:hypothetical protein